MADGNGTEPFDGRPAARGAKTPAAVDTEPAVTDPDLADPDLADPDDPDVADQDVAGADLADPDLVDPELAGIEPAAADAPVGDGGGSTAGTEPATADDRARIPHGRAVTILGLVAVLAVTLDIVTKQLAVSHLRPGDPVRILGGAVFLLLTRNSGAAWSMGTGVTWVFPVIAILVVCWITWMALRLRSLAWAISLGLVLGGAMGNLLDRLFRSPGPFRGQVVDFISVFDDAGQKFPIFNAADSCLCIGVVLAVILELTGRRRDGLRVRH